MPATNVTLILNYPEEKNKKKKKKQKKKKTIPNEPNNVEEVKMRKK